MPFPWQPEHVDFITRLWLEGKSATEIARAFNATIRWQNEWVSRNAILGKLGRAGLLGKGAAVRQSAPAPGAPWTTKERPPKIARPSTPPAPTPAARVFRQGSGLPPKVRMVADNGPKMPEPESLPPLREVKTPGVPLPLDQRPFGVCCYPVSGEGADTLYCCAATARPGPDWAYCRAHRKIMFDGPALTRPPRAVKDTAVAPAPPFDDDEPIPVDREIAA